MCNDIQRSRCVALTKWQWQTIHQHDDSTSRHDPSLTCAGASVKKEEKHSTCLRTIDVTFPNQFRDPKEKKVMEFLLLISSKSAWKKDIQTCLCINDEHWIIHRVELEQTGHNWMLLCADGYWVMGSVYKARISLLILLLLYCWYRDGLCNWMGNCH